MPQPAAPSRLAPSRHLVARNVVATSQPLASRAGLRMLEMGGNAVDAAIAAAAALMVVEPVSSGLGADAFALVWDGNRVHALNASGSAPQARRATPLADLGWPSVTVPGAVAGWAALSKKFGALPFRELLQPAFELARDGYAVTPTISRVWRGLLPMYLKFPEVLKQFYPGGRGPEPGSVVRLPQLADSLDTIGATHGAALYSGDLARQIVAYARSSGGDIGMEDLASHRADWVEPLSVNYRGARLHEMPPNSQGVAALIALGILAHFELAQYSSDSADSMHLQIEAMKLALADVYAHVADPQAMRIDVAELLDSQRLKTLAQCISTSEARFPVQATAPQSGGTSYLASADASGMMVSYIQSSGPGFGSGVMVPDTGIALQSRAGAFHSDPRHPNAYAPGKRPFHTNCPALLTVDREAHMAFGLMGWTMQPQAHVQFVVRAVDYGEEPLAILAAPRWRIAFLQPAILLEAGCDPAVAANLAARGHRIDSTEKWLPAATPFGSQLMFGGANLVTRVEDGYSAICDTRRDGAPAGF